MEITSRVYVISIGFWLRLCDRFKNGSDMCWGSPAPVITGRTLGNGLLCV